jgi:transposase-like protein
MANHDDPSTYADLLARLGDEGTKELFRRLPEEALQDLVDDELTAQIGASRHAQSDAPSNHRNGGRGLRIRAACARLTFFRWPWR